MEPTFRRRWRAFTLVELIVVILIIGVLAALAVVGYSKYSDHAKVTAAKTQLREIATAISVDATSEGASELTRDGVVRALEEHVGVTVHTGQSAARTWDLLGPDEQPTSAEDFSLAFEDASGTVNPDAGTRLLLSTSTGSSTLSILIAGPGLDSCFVPTDGDGAAGELLARTPYCPPSERDGSNGNTDTVAPGAATELSGVPSGLDVALTWTAAADNTAVAGYEIHRSTEAGFTPSKGTKVGFTRDTAYTDTTPGAGTWHYRVVAFDAAGNSTPSSATSVTTAELVTTPQTPAPSAALDTATGVASVTWPDVAGAASYVVQWSVDGGPSVQTEVTSTSWTRTVSAGQELSVQVAAKNSAGQSPWSDSVTARRAPDAPAIAGAVTDGLQADVTWSAPSGATSYVVRYRVAEGDWDSETTTDTHVRVELEYGTTLTVQVAAVSTAGQGAWSTALGLVAAPAAPAVTGAFDATTGESSITWTAAAGAESYVARFAFDGGAWIEMPVQDVTASRTVSAGQSLAWQVAAVNQSGRSSWSSVVTHTRAPISPVLSGSFDAASRTSSITWEAVASATMYNVRYQVDGGAWVETTTSERTATKTVNPGQTVTWQAAAGNAGGTGLWSAALSHQAVPGAPQVTTSVSDVASWKAYMASWTAVPGASSYVCQYTRNGGPWTAATCSSKLTLSQLLSPAEGVALRVASVNATGQSDWTTTDTFYTVPDKVLTSETYTAATRTSALTWSASGVNVPKYKVQYRLDGGSWVQATTPALSASQVLTPGQKIEWQVAGLNAGDQQGEWSEIKTRVAAPSAPVVTAIFDSVMGFTAPSWPAVQGASYYLVQHQIDGGAWSTPTNTTAGDYSLFLDESQSINWKVAAVNASGETWSTVATATYPVGTPVVAAPTSTTNTITWTWTNPYGKALGGYEYQYSTNGTTWTTGGTTATSVRTVTKGSLASKASVYLRVRAKASNGVYSAWSTPVVGTTK